MSHTYTSIGTTARAEPVNNAAVLFPSGCDLNENRKETRPLVQVLDTAGENDEFSDDEFGFKDDGTSENVTVTIKYNTAINSVVTETDTRLNEKKPETEKPKCKDKPIKRPQPIDAVSNYPICIYTSQSLNNDILNAKDEANSSVSDKTNNGDDDVTDCAGSHSENDNLPNGVTILSATNAPENGHIVLQQDTLYDEYEKFVTPLTIKDENNKSTGGVQPVRKNDVSAVAKQRFNIIEKDTGIETEMQLKQKPDNDNDTYEGATNATGSKKIISPIIRTSIVVENEDHADRKCMVSPKTKTRIVRENSSSPADDGEDFMKYLQDLRNKPPDDISQSDDLSDRILKQQVINKVPLKSSESTRLPSTGQDKIDQGIDSINETSVTGTKSEIKRFTDKVKTDSKESQNQSSSFRDCEKNSASPKFEVSNSNSRQSESPESVIVISDDEDDNYHNNNTLASFNFGSLKKKRDPDCAGNGVFVDFVSGDEGDVDTEEHTGVLQKNKIRESLKTNIDKSDNESSSEESEYDDAKDDTDSGDDDNNDEDDDRDCDDDDDDGTYDDSGDDQDDNDDENDGNGSINDDENGQQSDNEDTHDNDNNNEGRYDDDESDSNGSYDNEWFYSPGMRSRRSLGAETVSDFEECIIAENDENGDNDGNLNCDVRFTPSSDDDYSAEDREIIQIMDTVEQPVIIDCHFETISEQTDDSKTFSESCSFGSIDDDDMNQTDASCLNVCVHTGQVVTGVNGTKSLQLISAIDLTKSKSPLEAFVIEDTQITRNQIASVDEQFDSSQYLSSRSNTTSLFSDSSSDLEIDNESDFESALEDEFWDKTLGAAMDKSESDTFSSIGTPEEDLEVDELTVTENSDINEMIAGGDESEFESATEIDVKNDLRCDLVLDLEQDQSNLEDTDGAKYDNEFKENESDNKAIAELLEQMTGKSISSELNTDINNSILENNVFSNQSREITKAKSASEEKPLAFRMISFNVPFIKEIEKPALIDPFKQKKIKYICECRKRKLGKLLPTKHGELSQTNETVCEHLPESANIINNKEYNLKRIEHEIGLEKKYKTGSVIQNAEQTLIKPDGNKAATTELVKLGTGYYIFGTGDALNLPIGPKLKKKVDIDLDKDIDRPCLYFRGVPGIINNACKMSNYIFPKLPLPKDASSHKILHACNRLATQLSPIKQKPKTDFKHGMMQEDTHVPDNDDSDSTTTVDLNDLLMNARDYINSARFDDAESTFLKLYNEIQEKPEDNSRLLVETLTGLADICIRRSRMCRSNPLEWQWLCMHAIALLQYTAEFCDSELERKMDNQEIDWFQEQKLASELKCRPLEDAFLRALYNCLKHDANFFDPFQSFSLPNTPVSQNRKTSLFPLSSTMPQYLVVPGMRYRITEQGLTKQSADDSDVTVDWLAKFQHYCKDRLMSKDSKGVTEKILKSTKSKTEDDTESVLSNGSQDSLDWDNSDLHGIEEVEVDLNANDKESPVNEYSLEYELSLSDTEQDGWDFFLHQRRNCNFQSVVQMASDNEKNDNTEKELHAIPKDGDNIYQHEKSEKGRKKYHEQRDIVSPLHEHSISLTLSRSFCRLADKLVHEEEYRKAEAVYEKILDIIDNIQDGTAGMLRFSARIMKNLGTVKSKQGKSSSGLVLLNKALNTYRDLQDEEANFEIAVSLIELGNGYIVGKNHEDSVFDDVIVAICDFFEKDASDSQTASTSGSASQISQMSSSLGSNNDERNVEEAVMCYTEAIALLDHYEADEKQVDMFAKAIMRLGDCYFMQKDYDKALECFERALGMFRTNNMFGKDSLMENAHVLCMLGVSSFMLHVYPRAASVFEMALHMVRCAYGFKRTFLNGMLQSLSGITYYKMKNYHKCVSMCYQGYETYSELFGEGMCRLDKQKFWLVCQTLYVMGNSYNILNLQQKAMKYLSLARSLMKSSKCRERRQFMRVLQILGDCYFAQYDYKVALTFYNEALEYGECESQVSFDEVFDPNCASDEMTIHNHLVSKSAEAHLSMQQYQNAVHYLEQAHDMQEVMGEDIKEDLINTLNQLGHMHSMAGDVDKAIESYKESLEVFREIHKGTLGPDMCTTLGNLGGVCYVKACIAEDANEEHQMTLAADSYFQEAMKLEVNAEVCVKYGNYLYSHCNYATAITYLKDALKNDKTTADIVYGGIEKVTLPDLLQDEIDTQEEICLPSTCLARYLLVLCYKAMGDMKEAELNLMCLMEEVLDYDVPILHSLLGYAMMELMLFEDAAESFLAAAEEDEDYQLAYENFCICLLIIVLRTLQNGVNNIFEYLRRKARVHSRVHSLPLLQF